MNDHQQDCQNFWCAAYLAAVSAGFAEDAADTADRALLDYDSRFAPVEEPAPLPEIDPEPTAEKQAIDAFIDLLG